MARDLALGLAASLCIVMVCVGILLYGFLLNRADSQFDRIVGDVGENLARVLSVPLEQGNKPTIDNIARAYLASKNISEIRVHGEKGPYVYRDANPPNAGTRVLEKRIRRNGRDVGRLVVVFSRRELEAMQLRFIIGLLILTVFIVAGVFFTARFFIKRIIGTPLGELLKGIDEIAGGHYERRLTETKHSDVNSIIVAVNRMALQIQERNRLLENSEAKYRRQIEGSREIIFAMDERGGIFTMNQAVSEHLGFQPGELIGKSFPDMAYQAGRSSGFIVPDLIRERLREVITSEGTAEMNVEVATRIGEPYELNIRLEYVALEGAHVIHGRAAPAAENTLTRHCETEKQTYLIGNNLILAELLNQRVTAALSRYMEPDQIMPVRLGLREILINAIEHGNLDITFEEKSKATMEGTLMGLIQERRADERFRDRRITVEYFRDDSRVEYLITDQGRGFDHREVRSRDIRSGEDLLRMHGRGIALADMTFDRVEYNEVGNQVRLVKYFQDRPAPEPAG